MKLCNEANTSLKSLQISSDTLLSHAIQQGALNIVAEKLNLREVKELAHS